MLGFDLAPHIDGSTWGGLQNCINEARQVIDPVDFLTRTGFTRPSTMALWSHLDQGRDAHPLLSAADLHLAVACIDLACELVDDVEFETRVGFDKSAARRLAATLQTAAAR